MILNKKKIILGSLGVLTVGVGAGIPIAASIEQAKITKANLLRRIKQLEIITKTLQKNQSMFKKLIGENTKLIKNVDNKYQVLTRTYTAEISRISNELKSLIEISEIVSGKKESVKAKLENIRTWVVEMIAATTNHRNRIINDMKELKKTTKALEVKIASLETTTALNNTILMKIAKIRQGRIEYLEGQVARLTGGLIMANGDILSLKNKPEATHSIYKKWVRGELLKLQISKTYLIQKSARTNLRIGEVKRSVRSNADKIDKLSLSRDFIFKKLGEHLGMIGKNLRSSRENTAFLKSLTQEIIAAINDVIPKSEISTTSKPKLDRTRTSRLSPPKEKKLTDHAIGIIAGRVKTVLDEQKST